MVAGMGTSHGTGTRQGARQGTGARQRVRTAGGLAAAGLVLLAATGCSSGPSGDETAWAGAMCTATENAVLASNLVADDVPPPEALSDTNLALYQARLGTEIARQSDTVEALSSQLASVPRSLSDAMAPLNQPVADVTAAFTASGPALGAVTGAVDVASATTAMPAADAATQKTQSAALGVVRAIQATGNEAFTQAPTCRFPSLSAAPSASAS